MHSTLLGTGITPTMSQMNKLIVTDVMIGCEVWFAASSTIMQFMFSIARTYLMKLHPHVKDCLENSSSSTRLDL